MILLLNNDLSKNSLTYYDSQNYSVNWNFVKLIDLISLCFKNVIVKVQFKSIVSLAYNMKFHLLRMVYLFFLCKLASVIGQENARIIGYMCVGKQP